MAGKITYGLIFGVPHIGRSTTTEEFANSTRNNLQIAFELTRRNLSERVDKQRLTNPSYPLYRNLLPDKRCWYTDLIRRPIERTQSLSSHDEGRTLHIASCRRLVVYRVRIPDDTKQVSVHLAHIKSYKPPQSPPAPDFRKLEDSFLGKTLPTPALDE